MEGNLLVKRNLKDIFTTNRQDKVCGCTLNEKQTKKTIKPSRDEWIKKIWYVYVYVYVYICVYMCICVYIYVCMCMYTYIRIHICICIYSTIYNIIYLITQL